jgi:hypothetical protein
MSEPHMKGEYLPKGTLSDEVIRAIQRLKHALVWRHMFNALYLERAEAEDKVFRMIDQYRRAVEDHQSRNGTRIPEDPRFCYELATEDVHTIVMNATL